MLYSLTIVDCFIHIHIAPLWHLPAALFRHLDIKQRIVMGDLDHPEHSINLLKSMSKDMVELIEQFHAQERVFARAISTVNIPTHIARQVPIPYALVSRMSPSLREPLLTKAFQQFVGRVPASLPWSKDISSVNLKTIVNMFSITHKEMVNDVMESDGAVSFCRTERMRIKQQVDEFVVGAPVAPDSLPAYKKRLERIAMLAQIITKTPYRESVFAEASLQDPAVARANWDTFINRWNCDLTPAYDLLAWVVIEVGYLPSVEECKRHLLQAW